MTDRPWTSQEDAYVRMLVQRRVRVDVIVQTLATQFARPRSDVARRVMDLLDMTAIAFADATGRPPPRVPVGINREMLDRRACAHDLAMLYRYRPMRNETELDRACGEALFGRFYFPNRAQLNDDLDLSPPHA